jgi:hypothetical protein
MSRDKGAPPTARESAETAAASARFEPFNLGPFPFTSRSETLG